MTHDQTMADWCFQLSSMKDLDKKAKAAKQFCTILQQTKHLMG
jgi:hypothetical protein